MLCQTAILIEVAQSIRNRLCLHRFRKKNLSLLQSADLGGIFKVCMLVGLGPVMHKLWQRISGNGVMLCIFQQQF